MGSGEKVALPFGVVPLLLGFGLALTGALLLFVSFRPDMDATATGTISSIDQGMSSSHVARCGYDAVFTVDGRTYVASSLDSSAANCERQIGEEVVVEYNAANPARSQIRADDIPWLAGGLCAGGALLLLLGVALLVRAMRRPR